MLGVAMLRVMIFKCYAECHYAEFHGAHCPSARPAAAIYFTFGGQNQEIQNMQNYDEEIGTKSSQVNFVNAS
jgi:hypothetical protein